MNCDLIASAYRWFEYAAFARSLEKSRFAFLDAGRQKRRALLLGEGDGRFLLRLAASNTQLQIDCVDLSRKMIELQKARIGGSESAHSQRIRFMHADIRAIELPESHYDLVVTNFFLDCFTGAEVSELVRRIRRACTAEADWIISEFNQPVAGWRARHARLWLRAMYFFFAFATGLKTRSLPAYSQALVQSGFRLVSRMSRRADLISSELWTLTAGRLPT